MEAMGRVGKGKGVELGVTLERYFFHASRGLLPKEQAWLHPVLSAS